MSLPTTTRLYEIEASKEEAEDFDTRLRQQLFEKERTYADKPVGVPYRTETLNLLYTDKSVVKRTGFFRTPTYKIRAVVDGHDYDFLDLEKILDPTKIINVREVKETTLTTQTSGWSGKTYLEKYQEVVKTYATSLGMGEPSFGISTYNDEQKKTWYMSAGVYRGSAKDILKMRTFLNQQPLRVSLISQSLEFF